MRRTIYTAIAAKAIAPIDNDFPLAMSSLNNANQLKRYNNKLTVEEQCFTNIVYKLRCLPRALGTHEAQDTPPSPRQTSQFFIAHAL